MVFAQIQEAADITAGGVVLPITARGKSLLRAQSCGPGLERGKRKLVNARHQG